ncbi:hypothetical protein [Actinomadura rifamycini]|uniref:hypothetical protein n=1 Tax=Actinomadura rifamycini TaxID=31962 RepID=UPI00040DB266|nr:hypothetical protein [Actinomadura rifamycini]
MQPDLPQKAANELRPRRAWYAAAAAIAVVLTVLGTVIGAYRLDGAIGAVGTGDRFANGDTVTLRLDPGSDKAIWVMYPGRSPGPTCGITGPGDPRLTDPGTDVFLTRDETWALLYTIDVTRAGDHEITCSSGALSRYAIGDPSGGLLALGGGLLLAALLPVLGIGAGAAIALVTALRRRAHRKRLRAERDGPDHDRPAPPAPADEDPSPALPTP